MKKVAKKPSARKAATVSRAAKVAKKPLRKLAPLPPEAAKLAKRFAKYW